MSKTWERAVPVYDVPIWTRPFKVLCGLIALGLILVAYREVAGLGPASGMNDAYAWGIWKTFNTMVLTGLGSGAFAIGIAAWIFNKSKLHVVMRTAVLSSFMAYAFGLCMLGVDVGRPWNFYWVAVPWHWNLHSPLLEVAVCMSVYASIPLFLENIPPILDFLFGELPNLRPSIEKLEKVIVAGFPFVVALAYVLPAMHQSSLGALMLLGGVRVSPLWQTPFLPLLYVWAAAFLGFGSVTVILLLGWLVWKRAIDMEILSELQRITAWLIGAWLVFRVIDLSVRGQILAAFRFDIFAFLFWLEMAILTVAFFKTRASVQLQSPRTMFYSAVLTCVGGMLYRFDPTTTAFSPKPAAAYFPSVIEVLISVGFMSLGVAIFVFAAKVLPILPGSNELARKAEAERAKNPVLGFLAPKAGQQQFVTGD
jgi:Ni/Fe-hydrogenase subunit HybB-like protein